MRMRISKKKNWRRAEIAEVRTLIDTMTNKELCSHFNVDSVTLQHAFNKYNIKRSTEILQKIKQKAISGKNNPNWRGGISKDGARYSRIQRGRYPERKHARDAVYRALKDGRLVKPERCERCGEIKHNLQGHHKSYEKDRWLEVEWLCIKCHRIADKELEQDLTCLHE